MKQAILITAYKNYDHLEAIITSFDDDFECFIHIDKKNVLSKEERFKLEQYNWVKLVSQKYKVNWGGVNHLKSILYLSSIALKNPDVFYFHLISGHDFPIKNKNDFKLFFKVNSKNHIDCFEIPFFNWGDSGGLDRLEYYSFYDLFNWKTDLGRRIIKKLIHWQKKIGFKRSLSVKTPKIYAGSTWWSLSREALRFVVERKDTTFLKRLKHTFCSEEFYFQTVLMNSSFKNSIDFDNLRFIDWSNRNGNNPSVLDETDFETILKSNAFFARRFEFPTSLKLRDKVKKNLD